MERKALSLINKAYDCLYDLDSKFSMFNKEKESMENEMLLMGYKPLCKSNKVRFVVVKND